MIHEILTPQQIKIRCYVHIAWGIVTAFVVIGSLVGHPMALVAVAILAISWVVVKIIGEMMDAFMILKRLKSTQR